METYRFETNDGVEHLIRVLDAAGDDLACVTLHRLGDTVFREVRDFNKCLFEELVGLGILVPDGT